jgi:transposase InsO family protein
MGSSSILLVVASLTVMDNCSRYTLAWRLCSGMSDEDVKATIDLAIAAFCAGSQKNYMESRIRLAMVPVDRVLPENGVQTSRHPNPSNHVISLNTIILNDF